jgi:hypothetical protein
MQHRGTTPETKPFNTSTPTNQSLSLAYTNWHAACFLQIMLVNGDRHIENADQAFFKDIDVARLLQFAIRPRDPRWRNPRAAFFYAQNFTLRRKRGTCA